MNQTPNTPTEPFFSRCHCFPRDLAPLGVVNAEISFPAQQARLTEADGTVTVVPAVVRVFEDYEPPAYNFTFKGVEVVAY